MRRFKLAAAAAAAAAILLVPAGLAGTPNGQGLFGEHESTCTGAFAFQGLVTLVPGSGTSFWVAGHHLVIRSAMLTFDGGALPPVTLAFGQKTGQSGATVTCTGHFPASGGLPGYTVESHDVLVP